MRGRTTSLHFPPAPPRNPQQAAPPEPADAVIAARGRGIGLLGQLMEDLREIEEKLTRLHLQREQEIYTGDLETIRARLARMTGAVKFLLGEEPA